MADAEALRLDQRSSDQEIRAKMLLGSRRATPFGPSRSFRPRALTGRSRANADRQGPSKTKVRPGPESRAALVGSFDAGALGNALSRRLAERQQFLVDLVLVRCA